MGFAAAKMDVRAFSVALMPALAIEIVCCSIASWMATWSFESIYAFAWCRDKSGNSLAFHLGIEVNIGYLLGADPPSAPE